MYIMGKHFHKRAVNTIIAALLLIAITVAAAILLYVFAIGLMGSLGSAGGSQTKQQLVLEAYNWAGGTNSLTLNLRNVGSAAISVPTADVFINGINQGANVLSGCSVLQPQDSCSVTFTPDAGSGTFTGGVSYVVKIVTPDGAVFSYNVIDGQAS
jgi:flagellin-like protein